MELQDKVVNRSIDFSVIQDQNLRELLKRILEKDPTKRATLEEILENPWVTNNGATKI